MTAPSPFLAWKSEAERLINTVAERAWQAANNSAHGDSTKAHNCLQSLVSARAALSAHLLAVPIGERVGYFQTDSIGQTYQVGAEFAGDSDVFPLFTKPEGMA